MAELKRTRLGDVAEVFTGFPFKSSGYTAHSNDVRLLRGDNIVQGTLRWDGVKRWPVSEISADIEQYALREGDVVVAMDRPWIEAGLKYASIRQSDLPSLLVQRVSRLRPRGQVEKGFLKYVIGSKSFTDHVLAVQTGTAVPHISPGQIKSYEFDLPDAPHQRTIVEVLGALDDKVELNRCMRETLESIARTLFVERLVPRELDSEWVAVPLDSAASFLNGLALQKYPPTADGSLPVIKISELRAGVTPRSDRASIHVPEPYVVHAGDLLFSWSGTLEVAVWTGPTGALNQHLFKVSSGRFPRWFVRHWLLTHLPKFRAIAADKATTMGHIQRRHLSEASLLVPPDRVLAEVSPALATIEGQLDALAAESRTLADLRDSLLPRLLAGELRRRDAEREVALVI